MLSNKGLLAQLGVVLDWIGLSWIGAPMDQFIGLVFIETDPTLSNTSQGYKDKALLVNNFSNYYIYS